MNLIIESVTVIDLTNKEAKTITFSEGKNFLTSDGNHYGKSVIMKAIYYSLGAEVYFSTQIKQLNLLTSVCFFLKGSEYKVYRLNNSFVLYKNDAFIKKYSSVGEFGNALSEIIEFEIDLVGKDDEGTIIKCPPAIYFLPYYIDQENGWSANSYSFNNMSQFDKPQKKDSYFFHLGVLDEQYVTQKKQQTANDRQIKGLSQANEKYRTVIDTLKAGLNDADMSFDPMELDKTIHNRKAEIDIILKDISKVRKDLIETEDLHQKVLNEKELLSKYLKKKSPEILIEEKAIECPRCGLFFEPENKARIEKLYLFESLNDDFTQKSIELEKLEKRIRKLKDRFKERHADLDAFEKSLGIEQDLYETYQKAKATQKLLDDYRDMIAKNIKQIEDLNEQNKSLKESLSVYQKDRQDINNAYLSNLSVQMTILDIPKEQVEANSEPGSSLIAAGAYGPRCKVAQVLSFLETQKNVAKNITSLPVVIDSPNVLEQDKRHLHDIIKALLTWDKTDNQIIVASIEGKEWVQTLKNVKIIDVTGKINHIMDKAGYLAIEDQIIEVLAKF